MSRLLLILESTIVQRWLSGFGAFDGLRPYCGTFAAVNGDFAGLLFFRHDPLQVDRSKPFSSRAA